MDPSSNNNNNPQYYPPPQQGYPQANPYPPQQSYPPTQQGYPSAPYQSPQQNYPQQGYPSQYDQQQQPQLPNFTQNNLDQLDQGGFQCYKVALGFAALLGLLGLFGSLTLIMAGNGFALFGLVQFMFPLGLIALIVIQFLAMKDRDLQKSKIALIGFLGYVSVSFLIQLMFITFAYPAEYLFSMLFSALINHALIGSLTIIGSFKVYQLLNENQIKSEPDFSQNQDQNQNQFQNQNQNQYQTQNYYAA